MARSPQVQRIIETLTPEVEAELAAELGRRERERARLAAAKLLVEQYEAEFGPVPEEELARVRSEWPRD
jgi:hypothetical protein